MFLIKLFLNGETGKGFPDVSILKSLSDELGVSVTELLSGSKLTTEEYREQVDEVLVSSLENSKNKYMKMFEYVLYAVIGLFFIVYMGIVTGDYNSSLYNLLELIVFVSVAKQIKNGKIKIVFLVALSYFLL